MRKSRRSPALPSSLAALALSFTTWVAAGAQVSVAQVKFNTHDGHSMLGKLVLPDGPPKFVVIYCQTAEGMTVDMRRPLRAGVTFDYFDLYRQKLPPMGVGFFSYEGRGIRMGDKLPRYEEIDRAVYDTSTLENKVQDLVTAIRAVRKQPGLQSTPIFLMGASEGTFLCARAAAMAKREVAGLILYGVMTSPMPETFRYIMTDGAFLVYQQSFDANRDGRITRQEFEADPVRYRQRVLRGADISQFDKNGDGAMTVEDMKVLTKVFTDAIDQRNFEVLDAWAKAAAAVSVPKDWFKDHFAQKPIWDYLKDLNIPVASFHGDQDSSVPIAGLLRLQEVADAAKKRQMEFHYFDGLDHSLNIGLYFARGEIPAGHKAIFDFIQRQVERLSRKTPRPGDDPDLPPSP